MRRPNHTATWSLLAAFLFLVPVTGLAQSSISSDIQRAETLIAQGDYVEALAAVRSASTQAPSDYRVRYYSGMALLGLQRFDEARTETELALSLAPEVEKAGVQRLLDTIALQSVSLTAEADAEAALAGGLNGRAARLFAQAFEADNTKTEAGLRAAALYAGPLSQPVDAVKVLRKIEAQSADGAARVKATDELNKLTSSVRPVIDELVSGAWNHIRDQNAGGAAVLLASAEELDPARADIAIQRVRMAALGDDARALEAALIGLAPKGLKIEEAVWKLPKAKYWAGQDWFVQLLEEFQGTDYARRLIRPMLADTDSFQDCYECPEMVAVPRGTFIMGTPIPAGSTSMQSEGPPRKVSIAYDFAVSKYEITWLEWDRCVADGACPEKPRYALDRSLRPDSQGRHPVFPITFYEAQSYIEWLNRKSGIAGRADQYRLLSASEWEYAVRAGTTGDYYNDGGPAELCEIANGGESQDCSDGYVDQAAPVGLFAPNRFGLHDMLGNVSEWVADCNIYSQIKVRGSRYTMGVRYAQAPINGAPHLEGDGSGCRWGITRGGEFLSRPMQLRSAYAHGSQRNDITGERIGLRLARTLPN